MIAMPETLTKICSASEPELVNRKKCPAKESKTPAQKIESDCWPHRMRGLKIGHRSPGQSRGMNRVTTEATAMKCKTRYGARFILSFGLNASNSQPGSIFP